MENVKPKHFPPKIRHVTEESRVATNFRQKIDGGTTVAMVTKVVGPLLNILKGMGP